MARRARRKAGSLAARVGERATPERRRKPGGIAVEVVDREAGGRVLVKRHRGRIECVLDHYYLARKLNDAQMQAALKFREAWLLIHFGANSTLSGNPLLARTGHADPEGRLIAHIDLLRWLDRACSLLTAAQLRVAQKVCGEDCFAGSADHLETLQRGLDRLAAHWGYA